jgi:superfamily II DNA or RNA helicase
MTSPPRPPAWRALVGDRTPGVDIALGLQLRQREGDEAHWGPRRVRAATARSVATSSGQLRLTARPLVRSAASDEWIQAPGSWEAVRRGPTGIASGVDPTRWRWLATLYGLAHDVRVFGGFGDSDWLTLDGVDSDLLWPHLRAAAGIGIPFVPSLTGQRFTFSSAAEVSVRVESADGGLSLHADVRVDGREPAHVARPIGHVGVYTVTTETDALHVRVAPVALGGATRALLAAAAPVPVPADELSDFLRDAYPRLAREAPVTAGGGVRLPPPDPTSLVLTVDQQPRDVVDFSFTWHPPGEPRAEWDLPHGVAGLSAEEARARRMEVEATWGSATDLPFAASGRLVGADAAEFVAAALPALKAIEGLRIEVSGLTRAYRELTGDPRITIRTVETSDADWFDLGVHVHIEGRRIPFAALFTALAQRRKKMLLSDGAYFSLAHPALDRLRDLIDESRDLVEWEAGPRISRYHLDVWEDFEDLADQAEPAVSWRETVRRASQTPPVGMTDRLVAVPAGLSTPLRPYQLDGFRWLTTLWEAGLGGILADDMGLGKTVQVLALLLQVRARGGSAPALVVAPTSVVDAWAEQASQHAPGLRVRTITNTGARLAGVDADVVVTSYALLRLDEAAYTAVDWSVLILDEAQAVKNPRTRVHRAARAVPARARIALTGTPLENSLTDLWAILSITSPGLFPSARRFRDEYVTPIERGRVAENAEDGASRARRLTRLRRRMRPFLLRRTKETVARDLPPRQEQDLRIELSSGHRAVYERILQRERRKVLGLLDDLDSQRFIVFRSLTMLRMLALAPSLVDAGGAGLESSKLAALRERIRELIAEGHRALVFSQFTSYLDIVESDLRAHDIGSVRLDGSTTRRGEVVEAFRSGEDPVFLISLKAGGVGLTLTEASYVFLLDPWWNPAAERQAIDRTHRIGQTRPVTVYRLIAAGTIEEKVRQLQERKSRLFDAVLDSDGSFSTALTADDIRELLA